MSAQRMTRRGPIASVGMPPMTMVFHVAGPELLEGVSAGERVRFQVERQDGRCVVIEPQREE